MRLSNALLTLAGALLPLLPSTAAMAQDPESWRQPEPYVSAPPPEYGRSTSGSSGGYLGSQTDGRYRSGQADGYGAPSDAYRPAPPSYGAPPQPRYDTARNGGYDAGGQSSSGQNGYGQGGYGAGNQAGQTGPNDVYVLPPRQSGAGPDGYRPNGGSRADDAYRPPPPRVGDGLDRAPRQDRGYAENSRDYGEPYRPPGSRYDDGGRRFEEPPQGPPQRRSYSKNEVIDTGHRFFGSVSSGLAKAVEFVFQKAGRPNGYILGEDAGGAFIAGLRYGEGTLHTKDAGTHRVYWQGPSLGYDFGGEGSKTMVLVYHLRDPSEIYNRFGGIQGSAYLVGGVSVQFQKHGDVILAPIRSGVGLRLGANVGYLKYTRRPTWNPF